ncbi:hypothetical protein K2P47_01530 [Patescibacteria group bacterium]|nr:hypothetical protein [Patescibacteria group bacterium]
MNKYIVSLMVVPALFLALATPALANSQVKYYQTNYQTNSSSQQQQIAQLYALIAQLQAQLAALQIYNPGYPTYNNGSYQNSNEITRVTTGTVEGDGDDAVRMEGSVTFRRDSEARVWFEYGTSNKLSYSTQSIEIDGDSGDTEDFEITATDLDDNDVYYYRAVAEDDDGRYVEGVVRSFRFDGRNDDDDDDDDYYDDDSDDGDWSLEVEDDYYETGDTIRVDYEVEDEDDNNWIGLYEVGDSDSNYVSFKYVRDEEGYVTFRINREGEYEFRLFDEDNDEQATSDEFEVED